MKSELFRLQVHPRLADVLTAACVDAVLAIRTPDKPVDLHMVELMEMQHKTATETTLIKGMECVILKYTTKFCQALLTGIYG